MPKPKIVNTMQEITQGELLTLQDLESLSNFNALQIEPLPDINYVLNISEVVLLHERLVHYPAVTITQPLSSAFSIRIPIIRNCVVVELVLKWALPALYTLEANLRYESTKPYEWGGLIYYYQRRAMMFATAANLYKQLVAELLPFFVVQDREIIKNYILSTLFSGCVANMYGALSDNLQKQIIYVRRLRSPSEIDQRMIDKWGELVNLVAALEAESYHYRRAHALYRYNQYLAELKQGTSKHMYPVRHPDDKKHGMRYIVPPTYELKRLLKDRQLELNPELAVANTVAVKVSPALLTFSHGLQKTKVFASSFMSNEAAKDEEQLRLLDKLEGYKPIYIAPREIKPSGIDDEICLLEKNLVGKFAAINQQDVSELLALAEEGLKLLSLVTMRYGISLNCKNDYSYFGLVKANSAIDKENYSKILISYYTGIFHNALKQLANLIHKNPSKHTKELTQFKEVLKTIVGYLQDMPNSSTTQVQTIIQELKNMRETSVLLRDTSDTQNSGLRHRTAAHTVS